jgi:hypothetical protein
MCYYHVCPTCGANLDPGENCPDCKSELPFVTVPQDNGTHKELFKEEISVNIIKVKFLRAGEPSGRDYTYYSEKQVAIGDKVQVNLQAVGVVTAVDVSEEEIAPYKDKVKFIYGPYQEPVAEAEVSPDAVQ